ncbi:MAG: PIN domain-containing protein [Chlamydiae bacterium]|nr:PIN domain-containing protein [Chlamydiota bacterium]MBI3277498.1 PIN domain-containing protein [Chlamydiota bacterium]
MGVLIDTCIWIDVERGKLSPVDVGAYTKKEPVFISPITIAELTYGTEQAKGNRDLYELRMATLSRLRKKPSLAIDTTTGEIFGRLAAYLSQQKRGHHFRIQDLWLASQAIQQDMKILTYNEKDFSDIPGLNLILVKHSH